MSRPIAIIGSGYSAAACVLQCHAAGIAAQNIVVIGSGVLGAGQAYGCVADEFRLNVRANLMRLWLDDPEHFPRWAADHIDDPKAETSAGSFYRRRDFFRYVSAQISAMPDHDELQQINAMATAVAPSGDGWDISLTETQEPDARSADRKIFAKTVILATGNPDPQWPLAQQPIDNADETDQTSGLVAKPWRGDWLAQSSEKSAGIKSDRHIAIIGAGLTAMDAIHGLACSGHKGQISVIAPHGILPPVQTDWQPVQGRKLINYPGQSAATIHGPDFKWPHPLRASGFLRLMRDHLGQNQRGQNDWHDVSWQERFEELRISINAAWQGLSVADRQKLVRRVGWLWSLTRFRSGPQSVESLQNLQSAGQLEIITGRLMGLQRDGVRWRLDLGADCSPDEPKAKYIGRYLHADVVVNCTGMGRDALVAKMRASGIIGALYGSHPDVKADFRLCRPDGRRHDNLFMIGPATGPALGDVVGSASISGQAQRLATQLAKIFG